MTKYLDGTEPDGEIAAHCPICRGKLVTRWSGIVAFAASVGHRARAVPHRVCPKCKIGVQLRVLPRAMELHRTREAARRSVEEKESR